MSAIVLKMALGKSQESRTRESWTTVVTPLVFAVVALTLGLYLPQPLLDKLNMAAQLLGGPAQ